MIQQTSLDAFKQVEITQSQRIVYNLLNRYSNLTNSEIAVFLEWSINRVTPRVNELVKLGKVEQSTIRECECAWCQRNIIKNVKPAHKKAIGWRVV